MDWNTRLFLRINSLVGRNRWLDAFGRAGAEWAIIALLAWFAIDFIQISEFDITLAFKGLLVVSGFWFLGMIIGYLVALFVREVRPHLRHPESKYLFLPLSNWKAFPSDHTYTAFFFFFLAIIICLPGAWMLMPLAVWVGWGRIYAGVHYPLDVMAGLALAGFVAMIYYFFADYLAIFLRL